MLALAVAALAASAQAATAPQATIAAQNGLEREILVELNQVRAAHGLPALRLARGLTAAADAHSAAMARYGFFAHESRGGGAFWKRILRFYGRGSFRTWSVGENLLWSSSTLDAAGAVRMWMDSPPHRRNILDRGWREVGLSAVAAAGAGGVFSGRDVVIVTSDFGARR